MNEPLLEPERYELFAGPVWRFEVDRREFLKVAGAGLFVFYLLDEAEAQQDRRRGGGAAPGDLGAWIHVDEKGAVSVHTGKVEVGQNIRTSLAQVVAEELRVPVDSVRMVMADTALVPFDGGTAGSRTTPSMSPQLRRAAAAARELILDRAAAEWKVDRAALAAADGRVAHPPSGRSAGYGELTKGEKLVKTVGADLPLTPPDRWKVAGTSVLKSNAREIVTGAHRYTSDVQRPGLLFGKIVRPPAFGAALQSADAKPAEELGATVVRDGEFLGVAAATEHQAARARDAIRAEWKTAPQPSGRTLFEDLRKSLPADRPFGNELKAADVRLEAAYTVAYIAHAPLEPRAAVAEWTDGKLTVWTGTQRPFGVRAELARAFGIPEDRVRVIVPDTGSGYGGKHTGEAAVEAARLAKGAGQPVKLVWSREEEFTWAYFRPAGVIDVRSGAMKDGRITVWDFHNVNSGGSGVRPPYDIPNVKAEFHAARAPLRQGSYRALASTANHFARESHVDEIAHALGMDPLQLRLRNLKDARVRAVLEAAAERFGWAGRAKEPGRGFGLACGTEKGGYVATCVEVRAAPFRVVRAVTAFECGAVINPEHLKNQVEGCVVMGLGGALFERIEFADGKILNPRFSEYRVPRLGDVPALETVLVDRKDLPSAGAGEAPIVAIAPAAANALFDATGERRRSLPFG